MGKYYSFVVLKALKTSFHTHGSVKVFMYGADSCQWLKEDGAQLTWCHMLCAVALTSPDVADCLSDFKYVSELYFQHMLWSNLYCHFWAASNNMLACGREYVHELHCCVHVVCTRKHGFNQTQVKPVNCCIPTCDIHHHLSLLER